MANVADWLKKKSLNQMGQRVGEEKIRNFVQSSRKPADFENFYLTMLENIGTGLKSAAYNRLEKKPKDNGSAEMHGGLEKALMQIAVQPVNCKRSFNAKDLAYIEPDTTKLAEYYFERSQQWMDDKKYIDCEKDIERALRANCPSKIKPELWVRRGICYEKLATECYVDAKVWLDKVPLNDGTRTKLEKKLRPYPKIKPSVDPNFVTYLDCKLPEIKSPHPIFPYASDAISVEHSKIFGRHIVAARDIDSGEPLLIEKPYFMYPNNNRMDMYGQCFHCLSNLFAAVACDHCVNVAFCSDECKRDAWEQYHSLDCLFLDLERQYIHPVDFEGEDADMSNPTAALFLTSRLQEMYNTPRTPVSGKQVSRFFFQMLHEAGGLQQLKNRLKPYRELRDHVIKWPLNEELYRKCAMEIIFTMCTNAEKVPSDVLREMATSAVRLTFLIAINTDIFGRKYGRKKMVDKEIVMLMMKDPKIIFVGGLLMRLHLLIFSEHEVLGKKFDQMNIFGRGYLMLPLLSLFNHSCAPNTYGQFKKGHFVMFAAHPIKKGEQIFDSYGPRFEESIKKDRQRTLLRDYHFTCLCPACKNNWPLYKDLKCHHSISKSKKAEEKITEILPALDTLGRKIEKAQLTERERDIILAEIHRILKLVHDGVKFPCGNIVDIMRLIEGCYESTERFYSVALRKSEFNAESQ